MTRRRVVRMVLALAAGMALALLGAAVPSARAAAPSPPVGSAPPATAPPPTVAPSGAPAGNTQVTLPAGPGTAAPGVAAPSQLSTRAKVAAVLGGLLLIGVLWAFSQGYGILGGHPRRRRLPPGGAAPDRL